MKNISNSLLYHLSLWLPLLFATPIIIMVQNPDDFSSNFISQVLVLLAATVLASAVSWLVVKIISKRIQSIVVCFIIASATVIVIQGYIVHGLFEYGQLDGHVVDWLSFGWMYWFEAAAFATIIILLTFVYSKIPKQLNTIAVVLMLFSLAQAIVLVPTYINTDIKQKNPEKVDDSVFEFSSTKNVIHILADGFQADIVKQVLDENPELAKQFTGFTFFENHLGHFQGTAPTIPSIFTGKFFDLDKGYNPNDIEKDIEANSYVNELSEAGYRLDFFGISKIYCINKARSCVNKSFNDLKSKGYLEHTSFLGDLIFLVDISIFRHVPMFLKEKIYNNGSWLLSAKIARDWSPYPDPVIREWADKMKITAVEPIYKWYHFIGTHIPAQWNSKCEFIGRQPQKRPYYKAQVSCILKDMAKLFEKMRKLNIYDNSTIIINGDHGSNISANDLSGETKNRSTYRDAFLGTVRPLFMMKKLYVQGDLIINHAPTTLEDIAPTILDVVGLSHTNYKGVSAFKKINNDIQRTFQRYSTKGFWTGKPIMYNEYTVSGDIRNRSNWQLIDLHNRPLAPSSYEYLSYNNIYEFSKGLSISKKIANSQTKAEVSGTEFLVLLSSKDDSEKTLFLKLNLPRNLKKQSLSISVNKQKLIESMKIEPVSGKASVLKIHVPNEFIIKGNNLFKFNFSETESVSYKVPLSAKIHSLVLK